MRPSNLVPGVALALSLAIPGAPEAAADAGYDKGFYIKSDDGASEMKLQGRVQIRNDVELPDAGDTTSAFSIPRARLTVGGTVFTKDLGYKLQVDFGKGQAGLKDFFVDWKATSSLRLRAGQTKRPFSRQQITTSGRQAFADRAITDKAFGAGRDIGVMLHNGYDKSPDVEWAVALMNGTGDKSALSGSVQTDPATGEGSITSGGLSNVPSNFHPQLVARVGINTGGIKGYSEGDLKGGDFRLAAGLGVKADFDVDGGDDGGLGANVDVTAKVRGFALDTAFYLMTAQDGSGFGDQSLAATGFHAQASYVAADRWMPLVRYARVMPDGADNDSGELGLGLNVLFKGHSAKLTAEAAMLTSQGTGGDTTDWLVRAQGQLAF